MNYKESSNAELTAKMRSLTNEYDATKMTVAKLIDKLKELDKEYLLAKAELNKRRGGDNAWVNHYTK